MTKFKVGDYVVRRENTNGTVHPGKVCLVTGVAGHELFLKGETPGFGQVFNDHWFDLYSTGPQDAPVHSDAVQAVRDGLDTLIAETETKLEALRTARKAID